MSEQTGEGFGDFHPEAAAYGPYNDAMAAWRNQVKAMQAEGTFPAEQTQQAAPEAQSDAEPTQPPEGTQESSPASPEAQEGAEGAQEGTTTESEPESAEQTMAQRDEADQDEPDAQADDDEPKEVYDPSAHTAPEVLEYLKGVGEDEAKRVLESEEAGKNRKGITSLKDDVLAKARSNDETGSGSTSA